MSGDPRRKRALILAGGGMKVAFQAGVLQVWLDEAGLTFDHADAASGGVFNLAMLCQGMTGLQIADNWRNLNPRAGVSLNARELIKLIYAESLFTLDNYRAHVFPTWGLDWGKIRASTLNASFNVFNFSRKELAVLAPKDMTEDFLAAAVSLPMWFPPVRIGGELFIDSVFLTDANIDEAIRRGADEIWTIWTVSEKDEWHPGFVATYFQIIETTADGHYRAILKRIAENNAAIQAGREGEFHRHIEVKELKADVALHYLVDFSQDRIAEAVNLGVQRAREWCAQRNIATTPGAADYPAEIYDARTRLSFTEEMKGFVGLGKSSFAEGYAAGVESGTPLSVHLTIAIDGVDRFVTRPEHDTSDVTGYVRCAALGGDLAVEAGTFNLFVDHDDPAVKSMRYSLVFRDDRGRRLALEGEKVIKDDPGFDLWHDTSTLYVSIVELDGAPSDRAAAGAIPPGRRVLGAGIIRIHFLDFLKQLASFRVEGPTISDRTAALARFGRLFMGKLWDVYARSVLTSGPF